MPVQPLPIIATFLLLQFSRQLRTVGGRRGGESGLTRRLSVSPVWSSSDLIELGEKKRLAALAVRERCLLRICNKPKGPWSLTSVN